MGAQSSIEWTDASWTPIRARNIKTGKVGWYCEHSTTGCEFCYAEGMNKRLGTGLPFKPGHRKDVEIFLDEKMLLAPLRWKKPRMVFVCSMTDLFADFVTDEWIDRVFAVMRDAPQHTFQVLTKRAERMRSYVNARFDYEADRAADNQILGPWPVPMLPNLWLGVSTERQREADERIPHLLATRAAVRFISAEPLLGPIDLMEVIPNPIIYNAVHGVERLLDWVIVGGESGANARPMHPDWARKLRDQCVATGVNYFFKQWGEWSPLVSGIIGENGSVKTKPRGGLNWRRSDDSGISGVFRVGKKSAGRLLDGIEHNAMPKVAA